MTDVLVLSQKLPGMLAPTCQPPRSHAQEQRAPRLIPGEIHQESDFMARKTILQEVHVPK